MSHSLPGFGPAPLWRLPSIVGSTMLVLGLGLWLAGNPLGLPSVVGGSLALLLASVRLRQLRAEQRHLHTHLPAVSERTAYILRALNATPSDLAANAQGQISPAQWRRIAAEIGDLGPISEPLPAIQQITGPARITAYHLRSWIWYDLSIMGVRFRSTTDTIVTAIQRQAPYRIYFIELPTPDRLHSTTRIMLAAEGMPHPSDHAPSADTPEAT